MKKFLLLHYGFENPTSEVMEGWNKWFEKISDSMVEMVGFAAGREITAGGTKELAWDGDAITGYNIIKAENLDEAEKIAATNPFISAIRVYELREN